VEELQIQRTADEPEAHEAEQREKPALASQDAVILVHREVM
jgi:hypothetical protein